MLARLEGGAQAIQSAGSVAVLAARVAGGHDDAARVVSEPDARLGLVLMLAARAARAERLDRTFVEKLFVAA